MLKARILTACFLIPLVLWLLFFASPRVFLIGTVVIFLLASWEWSHLMGLVHFGARFLYFYIITFLLAVAFTVTFTVNPLWMLSITAIWWIVACGFILLYPRYRPWQSLFFRGVMGVFVLIPCIIALNLIRSWHDGRKILLFLLLLIWIADTAAYFVGRRFGVTKLAPLVSPGKSIQGLLGALLASFLYAFTFLFLYDNQAFYDNKLIFIVLCLITVLFSVAGDLFESMLKREVGIKDSGNLLPGHGGILDRIDSLTAAAPIFAIGILLGGFPH